MTNFKFDDTKDFANNLVAFLDHLSDDDPEMAAILRTHVLKLTGITDAGQHRTARTRFNASVKTELDELLAITEELLEE